MVAHPLLLVPFLEDRESRSIFEKNEVVDVFYNMKMPNDKSQRQCVESSQGIVKHTAPSSMYIFVYPSASKRLCNVDYTEQNKPNSSKTNCDVCGARHKSCSKYGNPCTKEFIDNHCTWVFSPISFHDIISPDSNDEGRQHQKARCNEQGHWCQYKIQENPNKQR